MWLLGLALILAGCKLLHQQMMLDLPWTDEMSWWWVVGVFALTAAWWAWADFSGYTRRRAEDRMAVRQKERREKTKSALGLGRRR